MDISASERRHNKINIVNAVELATSAIVRIVMDGSGASKELHGQTLNRCAIAEAVTARIANKLEG